jgi:hypothetical protein
MIQILSRERRHRTNYIYSLFGADLNEAKSGKSRYQGSRKNQEKAS